MVNKREIECIVMRHEDFGAGVDVYCSVRFCKVVSEGPPNKFFEEEVEVEPTVNLEAGEIETTQPIPNHLFHATNRQEDIQMLRALGLDVDNDNEPAPENIPEETYAEECDADADSKWGWNGFCNRKKEGFTDTKP